MINLSGKKIVSIIAIVSIILTITLFVLYKNGFLPFIVLVIITGSLLIIILFSVITWKWRDIVGTGEKGIKTLLPNEAIPYVIDSFYKNCAEIVTVQLDTTGYPTVKVGEDKYAKLWVTNEEGASKRVLCPLNRGKKAILGFDFYIDPNTSRTLEKSDLRKFHPKEATDPYLESLKDISPGSVARIQRAKIEQKIMNPEKETEEEESNEKK